MHGQGGRRIEGIGNLSRDLRPRPYLECLLGSLDGSTFLVPRTEGRIRYCHKRFNTQYYIINVGNKRKEKKKKFPCLVSSFIVPHRGRHSH